MTRICLPLLLLVFASARAALPTNVPLLQGCEFPLRSGNVVYSEIHHNFLSTLALYTLTELPEFEGSLIELPGAPEVEVPAPELSLRLKPQVWTVRGKKYWFYDLGFRRLERDARDLNSAVVGQILANPGHSIRLISDPERRQVLKNLYNLRWLIDEAVMEFYAIDPRMDGLVTPEGLAEARRVARLNNNIDLFALFDEEIPLDATYERVYQHLVFTSQVSYDFAGNYLGPSASGLLNELGIPHVAPAELPFRARLVKEGPARETFLKDVEDNFGNRRLCEITRTIKPDKKLPFEARDATYYHVYNNARNAGCQVMTATVSRQKLRLFGNNGFTKFRRLPNAARKPEYLGTLEIGSPPYLRELDGYLKAHTRVRYPARLVREP